MALRLAGEELGVVQGDAAAAATLDETAQEFLKTLAALYGWDGADLSRLLVESAANANLPYVGPDRWLNNTEVTLLASAARTVSTNSPDQTNYNARGVILFLNVTAASGTGGLQMRVRIKDTLTGNYVNLSDLTSLRTTTGRDTLLLYPGASDTEQGDINLAAPFPLPRTWGVKVNHGDGSSYTYSLAAAYIL